MKLRCSNGGTVFEGDREGAVCPHCARPTGVPHVEEAPKPSEGGAPALIKYLLGEHVPGARDLADVIERLGEERDKAHDELDGVQSRYLRLLTALEAEGYRPGESINDWLARCDGEEVEAVRRRTAEIEARQAAALARGGTPEGGA